jgi:hypothetical protein
MAGTAFATILEVARARARIETPRAHFILSLLFTARQRRSKKMSGRAMLVNGFEKEDEKQLFQALHNAARRRRQAMATQSEWLRLRLLPPAPWACH